MFLICRREESVYITCTQKGLKAQKGSLSENLSIESELLEKFSRFLMRYVWIYFCSCMDVFLFLLTTL